MSQATSMQTERSFNQTRFLLSWILANLIGGFIVGFLEDNGMQFMATLILTGAIVGSLQWAVLRQSLRQLRWWPLASAIGWIGGTLGRSLVGSFYQPAAEFLHVHLGLWGVFWLNLVAEPVPSLTMAIAQALVLTQHARFSPRSIGLWILISTIAGAVRGAVGASVCAAFCPALPLALIGLVNGLAWAAYGVVTGIFLLRQLKAGDRTSA